MAPKLARTESQVNFVHDGTRLVPVRVMTTRPAMEYQNPDDKNPPTPSDDGFVEEHLMHLLAESGLVPDQGEGEDAGASVRDVSEEEEPATPNAEEDEEEEDEEDMKKSFFEGLALYEQGIDIEYICKKHIGFAKLTAKLAAKGATNPGALAAHIGRQKYGAKKMTAHAAAGKPLKESMKKSVSDVPPSGLPAADPGASHEDISKDDAIANAHTTIMGHIEEYTSKTDMDDDAKEELEQKIEAALRAHTSAISMSDTV